MIDEDFDTMRDVVQDPCGAWQAIQSQAARIEELEAENARLREALIAEREDVLWNAYYTGSERDGRWHHAYMSDGEWLARECGFDPTSGDCPADAIKAAIPEAAKRAVLTMENPDD